MRGSENRESDFRTFRTYKSRSRPTATRDRSEISDSAWISSEIGPPNPAEKDVRRGRDFWLKSRRRRSEPQPPPHFSCRARTEGARSITLRIFARSAKSHEAQFLPASASLFRAGPAE